MISAWREITNARTTNGTSAAVLICALMVAEINCSLESNMIFAALSGLYATYGDPVKVNWLITGFTLAAASSAAIGGRLGDIFGRRRVLLVMLALSISGSLLSATTDVFEIVVVGRVLQGMTMAILPLCFGLLRENLAVKDVGVGVGLLGSVYALTVGIGTVLGGIIVDNFNWQAIFLASALTGLLAFLATLRFVPPSKSPTSTAPLDLIGGILFAPAIAAIIYGISTGGQQAGGIGLLLGGVMTLIVWARYELRHSHPLLDLRLLHRREMLLVCLAMLLTATGPMMMLIVLLPLLQQPAWTGIGFELPAALAGMLKLPGNIVAAAAIVCGGLLAKRIGLRAVLLISMGVTAAGWIALALSHDVLWVVVVIMSLALSPGVSVVTAMAPQMVIANTPGQRVGEATGMLQVFRALGQALSGQVLGYCLATSFVTNPDDGNHFPTEAAFVTSFVVIAVLAAVVFALVAGLRSDRPAASGACL